MKIFRHNKLGLGILLALALVTSGRGQGFLITNGLTSDASGMVFVIQDPVSRDYTGFYCPHQAGDSFLFATMLDEGVRAFFVSANDPITFQAIQSHAYAELTYPNAYSFADGEPFYVGLYTGYNPWVISNGSSVYTGIYSTPVFGWAQLVNNGGTVQLLDGALGYNAVGIYAGTQILVPEPSTLSLFGLGLLGLAWRRWRNLRAYSQSDSPVRDV